MPFDGNNVGMMEQAVKDSISEGRRTENIAPFGKRHIGSDDSTVFFVTLGDKLEKEVSGINADRDIADFVDDEDFVLGEEFHSGVKPVFVESGGELIHQFLKRDKICRVPMGGTFNADRRSQMSFSNAARTDEQNIFLLLDEAEGS